MGSHLQQGSVYALSLRADAMIQFNLNAENFIRQSEELTEAIDVSKIVDAAAASQLNRIRARFLRQEDTDGNKWPESRAAQRRRASGRDGGTLFDTGTLFHSIGIKSKGDNQRSVGTNVEYAREHQRGEEGNPKREFIGVNDEDTKAMVKTTTLLIRRFLRNT